MHCLCSIKLALSVTARWRSRVRLIEVPKKRTLVNSHWEALYPFLVLPMNDMSSEPINPTPLLNTKVIIW